MGNLKHGMSTSRMYHSWRAMVDRCHNPKSPYFGRYGGRGIAVILEWRTSFTNFQTHIRSLGFEDIPPGHSIDRIDNERGYEPGNIRVVDRFVQANNKRDTKRYELHGKLLTLPEISRLTGIKLTTLHNRIRTQRLDILSAVSKGAPKTYQFEGKNLTIVEIAKLTGVKSRIISQRIRTGGMTIEMAAKPGDFRSISKKPGYRGAPTRWKRDKEMEDVR